MTACQHSDYVFSAANGKPGFLLAAKEDKKKTMKDLAKASYEALRAEEFPLRDYRLDSLSAPSYTKDVADQIGLAYGKTLLKAKMAHARTSSIVPSVWFYKRGGINPMGCSNPSTRRRCHITPSLSISS